MEKNGLLNKLPQPYNHTGYKNANPPITPCSLFSCNTGRDPGDGTDPFAQILAEILETPVAAPEGRCWIKEGKYPYSAPAKNPNNLKDGPDKPKAQPLKRFYPRPPK